MLKTRRNFISAFLAGTAILAAPSAGLAQDHWPDRAIRLVVPFAPGGSNDVIARKLATELTKSLGQSVVIENRGGAGGSVGANAIATSAPDGYNFLFSSDSLVTTAAVQKTPYKVDEAFDAITMVASAPYVMVISDQFPQKSVNELISYAKANPNAINVGSAGLGDSTYFAAKLFANTADIELEVIGYKGTAPALIDLVAGRLDMIMTTMASVRGTPSDKLQKLAFSGTERNPAYPEVPTVKEASGLDYVNEIWWGVFGPRGVPSEIRNRLSQEIGKIVAEPAFAEFLSSLGAQPVTTTPEQMQDRLESDLARWIDIAEKAGIRQK